MPAPTILNAATGQWVHAPAIAAPSGGTTTDSQARTAIGSILSVLREAGVIAGATHLPLNQGWNGTLKKIVLDGGITAPTGGTADSDLRTGIGSIIGVLASYGLINGGTADPSLVLGSNGQLTGGAIDDLDVDGTGDDNGRTAINSALAAMRAAGLIG